MGSHTRLRKQLYVQGYAFDVSIAAMPDGREVVRLEGPEFRRQMQIDRESAHVRAIFREELDRVREKRRMQPY